MTLDFYKYNTALYKIIINKPLLVHDCVQFHYRIMIYMSNAPINVNPVRGECRQGAGIWCLRLSPCRAFDRAKRPRDWDIWLWPTEAWYQFRRGYQVRPLRLSESHAIGERYEVNNVYFEKGFIFELPSDCKTRLKSNSTIKVRGLFTGHWSDLFRHVEQML